ncbi:MAG: mechanosensitive ion channel family protein [Acidilobaceae archaeon]|nr:mechanosensitive ion channel family protein [Acidilobaceae archaeon]MCX8165322.1 mechanosensitive ion channel family protein [Acidilobaceae archaeon]MDW7973748.1 mechanosensitive ion channel [Sulfolobales archaeon]
MSQISLSKEQARSRVRGELVGIAVYVVLYIIVGALLSLLLSNVSAYFEELSPTVAAVEPYVGILLILIFGYLIVGRAANAAFYSIYARSEDVAVAAAVKNAIFLLGLGALVVIIIGGAVGGSAALALAGFLAVAIGFATQQVLSQVLAGFFLVIVRPFKLLVDRVIVAGEEGYVQEINVVYTRLTKDDKTIVLIPNSALLGNKVYILTEKERKG